MSVPSARLRSVAEESPATSLQRSSRRPRPQDRRQGAARGRQAAAPLRRTADSSSKTGTRVRSKRSASRRRRPPRGPRLAGAHELAQAAGTAKGLHAKPRAAIARGRRQEAAAAAGRRVRERQGQLAQPPGGSRLVASAAGVVGELAKAGCIDGEDRRCSKTSSRACRCRDRPGWARRRPPRPGPVVGRRGKRHRSFVYSRPRRAR